MTDWNFADVWEMVADAIPHAPALIHGDRTVTWTEFDHRADAVAQALLDFGVGQQDKVAHYLYNCPEYLESTFAIFKVGLVPVNTNYRYTDDELAYLWENADAAVVIFHGTFVDRIEGLRDRVSGRAELAVGRRRQRPLPRLGHALRRGRHRRRRNG